MYLMLAAVLRILAISSLLAAAIASVAAIRLGGSDIVGTEVIVPPLAIAGTYWLWLSVRLRGSLDRVVPLWAHVLAVLVVLVGTGTWLLLGSLATWLSVWGAAFGLACLVSVGIHLRLVRQHRSPAA